MARLIQTVEAEELNKQIDSKLELLQIKAKARDNRTRWLFKHELKMVALNIPSRADIWVIALLSSVAVNIVMLLVLALIKT